MGPVWGEHPSLEPPIFVRFSLFLVSTHCLFLVSTSHPDIFNRLNFEYSAVSGL